MKDTILQVRARNIAVPPLGSTLLVALISVAGIAAGWGILNFPAIKVVAVGLGALCIIAAAWKIDYALYGVGFFMVILQEAETTPGTIFTTLEWLNKPNIPSLLELLFAVMAAAFFVRLFVMQDEKFTLQGMKLPLALFFALLFIAFAIGVMDGTHYITRKEDFKRFIFPVAFFVCAVNILDTREKIVNLLTVMFWAMLPKTLAAIFYYLQGLGFPYGDSRVVFLESGDQILIVTIIVVGISVMTRRKWDMRQWLFLCVGLAPMMFALLFSYRRNALWGTILSLGLMAALSQPKIRRQLLKVFALVAVGAVGLMAVIPAQHEVSGSFLTERLFSVLDRDQSSNRAHVNEWVVTVEDTMRRPLLGLGLGSEHAEVPDFEVLNRHTVHNAPLMLWMKMGAFALITFIWLFYRYLRMGFREARRRDDPLLTGLFATCGLWVISMNVGPAWFYYRESCLVALFMAAVIRLALMPEERAELEPESVL